MRKIARAIAGRWRRARAEEAFGETMARYATDDRRAALRRAPDRRPPPFHTDLVCSVSTTQITGEEKQAVIN